ncbi:MAG: hypothetical protein KTR31_36545 [Myxococcales bacterium]|nr:hypothetical protein [Myxococcales bacterium]
MSADPHLTLSLTRELWNELLNAALPVKLAGDQLDLAHNARQLARRLGVRQRVRGLLEDRRAPAMLTTVRHRAKELWRNQRAEVYRRLDEVVRLEGTWTVEVDHFGTELRYARQKVSADAYVRGVAEGTLYLLRENVEIPFRLERRVGASVALGDIRYDPDHRAVIGHVQDLGLYIGDGAALQVVSRAVEAVLQQQTPRVGPVPILRRAQVEEMVGPMGGSLNMQMGVEDLDLVVDERDMTLKIRFGFGESMRDALESA